MKFIRSISGVISTVAQVISLIDAVVCSAAEQQATTEKFKMRAAVVEVSILQEFKGNAVRAHFDPRYAATLRIASISPVLPNYTNGALVTFAIHSPVKLFADDTPKGKSFDFILLRKSEGGTNGPFSFTVQRDFGQTNSRFSTNRLRDATAQLLPLLW